MYMGIQYSLENTASALEWYFENPTLVQMVKKQVTLFPIIGHFSTEHPSEQTQDLPQCSFHLHF